jgi:DNA-binding GntR family transcriptional regulator
MASSATRPLTLKVRDELLDAIRSGDFADGRLPPESALALQLGVSRTTVRAVLQGLAADGLVTRRRRHGTVVNAHLLRASMPLNRLVSFHALIEQCGHEASADPQEARVDGARSSPRSPSASSRAPRACWSTGCCAPAASP